MSYHSANEAKATFDSIYTAPTPNLYLEQMGQLDYQIGQQARPYFEAAASLLDERLGPAQPVRVLDLGCSYGVGAALLNHKLSFDELISFFAEQAPASYLECVAQARAFLEERRVDAPVEVVGADCSAPAIRFALDAGLLQGGIARDMEATPQLPAGEAALVSRCNLMTSTGAIGYVGKSTISTLLEHLGGATETADGPYAVMTILRMFDPDPVAQAFSEFGYEFAPVPGVHLLQRRFESDEEQCRTVELLRERGLDSCGLESEGLLYADLFAAAPKAGFGGLIECLSGTAAKAA